MTQAQSRKKIALGTSDFGEVMRSDFLFVDKSQLIQSIIDSTDKVTLITRARRWGKTLNMSMLEHFFASEVAGLATAGLFDDLKIAKINKGQYVQHHQGKYPVIFISFKEVKKQDYDSALEAVYQQIIKVYKENLVLLNSEKLSEFDKDKMRYILSFKPRKFGAKASDDPYSVEQYCDALKALSEFLYKHYQKRVYILIDEYDTPLNAAYKHGYLDSLSLFLRDMFSAALKDNPYLEKGIMTGILRVSKNNMLSGLNNLECYSVLDKQYNDCFGFTETEVNDLFSEIGEAEIENIKSWYNGYMIGNEVLYNPWSIMNCLAKGEIKPFWVLTADDSLLRKGLLESSPATKTQFEALIKGQTITAGISESLTYSDLMDNEWFIWTLLLYCGYLKVTDCELEGTHYNCTLAVPNREVAALYTDIFSGEQRSLSYENGAISFADLIAD